MTVGAYQKMIDTVAADTIDWRRLAIEMGKRYPDIFTSTAELVEHGPESLLIKAVREHLRNGKKVLAIKLVRDLTGQSLSEAKAYVEALTVLSGEDIDRP